MKWRRRWYVADNAKQRKWHCCREMLVDGEWVTINIDASEQGLDPNDMVETNYGVADQDGE